MMHTIFWNEIYRSSVILMIDINLYTLLPLSS